MDAIANNYASDSDKEEEEGASSPTKPSAIIKAAPHVNVSNLGDMKFHSRDDKLLLRNPKAEELFAPIEGPLFPGQSREDAFQPSKTTLTGHVEFHAMDDFTFEEQFHTFQNFR